MIKKALLLASVLCVLNQTPVKAETYIEPYSHVTIEITEDYASSNDSFGSIELNGGICRVLWRHRRQKRTQEILNTPLDELADSILKKYGEEDDE